VNPDREAWVLALQRGHRCQRAAGGKLAEGEYLACCVPLSRPADVSKQWKISNRRIHIPVGKQKRVR